MQLDSAFVNVHSLCEEYFGKMSGTTMTGLQPYNPGVYQNYQHHQHHQQSIPQPQHSIQQPLHQLHQAQYVPHPQYYPQYHPMSKMNNTEGQQHPYIPLPLSTPPHISNISPSSHMTGISPPPSHMTGISPPHMTGISPPNMTGISPPSHMNGIPLSTPPLPSHISGK